MQAYVADRPPRVVLIQPHSGQQKILDGLKRFTVIRMGRRFGKTALSIRFLYDYVRRLGRTLYVEIVPKPPPEAHSEEGDE